jgi:hypothetical protein
MALPFAGRKLLTATVTSSGNSLIHATQRNQCSHCHTSPAVESLKSEATNFKKTGDKAFDQSCMAAILAHEHMGRPCSATPEYSTDANNNYHLSMEICHIIHCCFSESGQVQKSTICDGVVTFDVPYTGKDESKLPLTVGYTQVCGSSTLHERHVGGTEKSYICVDYNFWDTFSPTSSIFVWAIFSLISYVLIGVHLLLAITLNVAPDSNFADTLRGSSVLKFVPGLIALVVATTIGLTFWVAYASTDSDTLKDDGMKRSDDEDKHDFQQVKSFFETGVEDYSKDGLSPLAAIAVVAYFFEFYAAMLTYNSLKEGGVSSGKNVKIQEFDVNAEIGAGQDTFTLDIEQSKSINDPAPEEPPKVKVISAFATKRTLNGMKF